MATVTQIRTGLATRLATITGLSAHATAPGQVVAPAAIVLPGAPLIEFDEAFGAGLDDYNFRIMVLAQRATEETAQALLDAYLPRGTGCVKTAVEADGTLGGIVSYTVVQRIAEYGPIEWAGVIYMGAIFDVEVST